MRSTSSSISSRPCGSIPAVGSSRNTSFGSCTIACASFTRCRIPVENPLISRYRSSPSPTWYRTSAARCRASRGGNPLISAMWPTKSAAVVDIGSASASGIYPTCSRTLIPCDRVSNPTTFAEPEVGRIIPSKLRMSVVLPAPFAPRRPTEADGIERSMLSRARNPRYRLVNPFVSMTGAWFPAISVCDDIGAFASLA